MGLGKTIQIISFLSTLFHVHKLWPMLVVAPQSTIPNWIRELQKWAPDMRSVGLYGGKEARKCQLDNQIFMSDSKSSVSCHVLVVSFNSLAEEASILSKLDWQVLIVDEAQRLKSDKNQIYGVMQTIKAKHKVLLTGM